MDTHVKTEVRMEGERERDRIDLTSHVEDSRVIVTDVEALSLIIPSTIDSLWIFLATVLETDAVYWLALEWLLLSDTWSTAFPTVERLDCWKPSGRPELK